MDFEFIVCDSAGGYRNRGADGSILPMKRSSRLTEVSSVLVTPVRILGILASEISSRENGEEPIKEHLLLTRYNRAA